MIIIVNVNHCQRGVREYKFSYITGVNVRMCRPTVEDKWEEMQQNKDDIIFNYQPRLTLFTAG